MSKCEYCMGKGVLLMTDFMGDDKIIPCRCSPSRPVCDEGALDECAQELDSSACIERSKLSRMKKDE